MERLAVLPRQPGDAYTRLGVVAVVLGVCAMLTGCSSNIEGTATRSPDSFAEPEFPTPRPTRPDPSPPPTTANPRPAPSPTPAPGGEVLSPQNGYVFIETKSGKTQTLRLHDEDRDSGGEGDGGS